jgi:hypothetical protein
MMPSKKAYILAVCCGHQVHLFEFPTKKKRDAAIRALDIMNEEFITQVFWATSEV